ncbi:MAG TPA: helix-turn-helix domain-containing protein [Phycisphaerales bacterium]
MKSKPRRSVCPIACTLDLIGDRWTLLVVRDLFAGKTQYNEFTESPERIATNILADRLEKLCRSGLVESRASESHAGRFLYSLTAKGRSLFPLLESIRDWGLANLPGTQARIAVPKPR